MAKKSMIERENKRNFLVSKYESKRKQIQNDLKNAQNSGSFSDMLILQKKLQKLPVDSSKVRLRNRCWKTGRSRGFYKDFGLSRHVIREMTHEGLLPGVIKASW
jgi:small subunit ribosomal protein S14